MIVFPIRRENRTRLTSDRDKTKSAADPKGSAADHFSLILLARTGQFVELNVHIRS
jgi:hypothetical protein